MARGAQLFLEREGKLGELLERDQRQRQCAGEFLSIEPVVRDDLAQQRLEASQVVAGQLRPWKPFQLPPIVVRRLKHRTMIGAERTQPKDQ